VVRPYPQELNDIPMIVGRQMDGKDFAQMIIDNADEMIEQSRSQPLVMGIALHPYLVGQPYRLRHLRRALQHLVAARDRGQVWFTTPAPSASTWRAWPASTPRTTHELPITDSVGAWVPHGRFVVEGQASGPLAGLRFAAKDLFDVAGHTTGAGNPSWLATHSPATRHSDVVAQLLDAGATLMGKVLTDELAYSLHGDNLHYGTPSTPATRSA